MLGGGEAGGLDSLPGPGLLCKAELRVGKIAWAWWGFGNDFGTGESAFSCPCTRGKMYSTSRKPIAARAVGTSLKKGRPVKGLCSASKNVASRSAAQAAGTALPAPTSARYGMEGNCERRGDAGGIQTASQSEQCVIKRLQLPA